MTLNLALSAEALLGRGLRTASLAIGMLAVGWVGPASAGVVYDGGAPDQGGQIYSQSGVEAAWMSFTLAAPATVTGANWWGGCFPATTCASGLFFLNIRTDNAGVPGTTLAFVPIPNANETATGNLIGGSGGWNEYSYNASVPAVQLSANTKYWIDIQESALEPGGTWGWETTSNAPSGTQLVTDSTAGCTTLVGGGTYCALPQQLAFQLTGSNVSAVPEASTWAMMLVGFAGLGFLGYRSRTSTAGRIA